MSFTSMSKRCANCRLKMKPNLHIKELIPLHICDQFEDLVSDYETSIIFCNGNVVRSRKNWRHVLFIRNIFLSVNYYRWDSCKGTQSTNLLTWLLCKESLHVLQNMIIYQFKSNRKNSWLSLFLVKLLTLCISLSKEYSKLYEIFQNNL